MDTSCVVSEDAAGQLGSSSRAGFDGFYQKHASITAVSALSFLAMFRYVSPALSRRVAPRAYAGLTRARRTDWDTRLGSTVHALTLSLWVALEVEQVLQMVKEPFCSQSENFWCAASLSVGYFVADLIVIVANWKYIGDNAFLIHHCTIIAVITYVGHYRRIYQVFGLLRIFGEWPTPFLNIKFCLDSVNYTKASKLYVINGLVIVALFFTTRILTIPFFYYIIYNNTKTSMTAVIAASLVGDGLNIMWMKRMISGCWKTLKKLNVEHSTEVKSDITHVYPRNEHFTTKPVSTRPLENNNG